MRKPSRKGEFGIPDLESYYQAANLANIALILMEQNEADWAAIEKEHVHVKTLAEPVGQKKENY